MKRVNPESIITAQVRNILRLLRIHHFKHWGGPLSERGVPDIVGVLPGVGRMLLLEIKRPGGRLSPEQTAFLARYREAGAVADVIFSAQDAINVLVAAGYEPARKISGMIGG